MGIVKNEHGTYHVRRKVPDKLQAAVAQIMGADKPKVSWLKKSLGTKDERQANVRAKPVMMDYDKIIARAEASLKQRPIQSTLSDAEIKRIAAYHFASMLAEDDEQRMGDPEGEALRASVFRDLVEQGIAVETAFPLEQAPDFGLSNRGMAQLNQSIDITLAASQVALAPGDIFQ